MADIEVGKRRKQKREAEKRQAARSKPAAYDNGPDEAATNFRENVILPPARNNDTSCDDAGAVSDNTPFADHETVTPVTAASAALAEPSTPATAATRASTGVQTADEVIAAQGVTGTAQLAPDTPTSRPKPERAPRAPKQRERNLGSTPMRPGRQVRLTRPGRRRLVASAATIAIGAGAVFAVPAMLAHGNPGHALSHPVASIATPGAAGGSSSLSSVLVPIEHDIVILGQKAAREAHRAAAARQARARALRQAQARKHHHKTAPPRSSKVHPQTAPLVAATGAPAATPSAPPAVSPSPPASTYTHTKAGPTSLGSGSCTPACN